MKEIGILSGFDNDHPGCIFMWDAFGNMLRVPLKNPEELLLISDHIYPEYVDWEVLYYMCKNSGFFLDWMKPHFARECPKLPL